jgi:hypothetical protein
MPYLQECLDEEMEEGSLELKCTVNDLLKKLNSRREKGQIWADDWPRNARALSEQLRRYAPNLRRIGIEVEFLGRAKRGSVVRISRTSIPARCSA